MNALQDIGWIAWLFFCGALPALAALFWRPHGAFHRFIRWLLLLLCLQLFVGIWIGTGIEWWKGLAFDFGMLSMVAVRIVKQRSRTSVASPSMKERPLRPGRWILDYLIGVALFLLLSWAVAKSSTLVPREAGLAGHAASLIGLFIANQITASAALRVLNVAIIEDYRFDRTGHYVLATGPILLALVPTLIVHASPVGVLFNLLLLYLGWRYTNGRPGSVMGLVKELPAYDWLRARWR